jgi:ssDNA-binding Zn-finger/Zn-ribbon topoisomerase 1
MVEMKKRKSFIEAVFNNIIDNFNKTDILIKHKKSNRLEGSKDIRNNGKKVICDSCGNTMVLRKGKAASFYGCNSFPSCYNTYSVLYVKKHIFHEKD